MENIIWKNFTSFSWAIDFYIELLGKALQEKYRFVSKFSFIFFLDENFLHQSIENFF